MAELTPVEVQSWYKIITDFPGYWKSFNDNYQALLANANYVYQHHPEMKDEVDKLVNEGSVLYGKLLQVKDAVDGVQNAFTTAGTTIENWLSEAGSTITGTAEMAYGNVKDWFSSTFGLHGVNGLGILPIIWAGIAAGTAAGVLYAVSQWLTSVQATATRLNRLKELESGGMTPDQAASQVTKELGAPGSGSTFLGIPLKFLAFGILAIFVVPPLLNYLSKRGGKHA